MKLTKDCDMYAKKILKVKFSKNTKAKRLSGYNVYCMEEREGMEGDVKDIMKKLGATWKEMSDEERGNYNTKAKNMNEKAAEEMEVLEEDEMTVELNKRIVDVIKKFKKEMSKLKENVELEAVEESDNE